MRRARQIASLVFAATGLYMLFGGYGLGLAGEFGPGPGFFAFGIGVLLTVSSAFWFAGASRMSVETNYPVSSGTAVEYCGSPGWLCRSLRSRFSWNASGST